MIVVLGSVTVRGDALDEALAASREHVERSRLEPGCLEHGVYTDDEDPLRLVFVERWADRVSLARHFAVPASQAFVRTLAGLATVPPAMTLHEGEEIGPAELPAGGDR